MKYLLLVNLVNGSTEGYYSDDYEDLKFFAQFRRFENYRIFELNVKYDYFEVGDWNV